MNSSSTNKAADFWDSVYAKTGDAEEATRQTSVRFGAPPTAPTGPTIQMPGSGPTPADASQVGAPPGTDPSSPWATASGIRGPSSTISGPSEFFRGLGGAYANTALLGVPNA